MDGRTTSTFPLSLTFGRDLKCNPWFIHPTRTARPTESAEAWRRGGSKRKRRGGTEGGAGGVKVSHQLNLPLLMPHRCAKLLTYCRVRKDTGSQSVVVCVAKYSRGESQQQVL